MKTRLKFKCWNCKKKFSLFLETDEQPVIISECPYCAEEVQIDLAPYREKIVTLFRNPTQDHAGLPKGNAFTEIIPTTKPETSESSDA